MKKSTLDTHQESVPQDLDGGMIDANPDTDLDQVDRELLSLIQSRFPISPRPYALIAAQLGLSELEAFNRVLRLKERRVIRRIGANFQSNKLGFCSTLCAAKVPETQVEQFARVVNRHAGVTHNYLRRHSYNIWFTCIGPSREAIAGLLDSITAETGISILNLPAEKLYKIKVDFKLD